MKAWGGVKVLPQPIPNVTVWRCCACCNAGKEPSWYPLIGELGGPQSHCGHSGDEEFCL